MSEKSVRLFFFFLLHKLALNQLILSRLHSQMESNPLGPLKTKKRSKNGLNA
jgi:hypothetical protein